MSWVLLGHGYSNWIGGIFVNNPNVSLKKSIQVKKSTTNTNNQNESTKEQHHIWGQPRIEKALSILDKSLRRVCLQWLYTFMMGHGEFAVVVNALPSVDSFFLIGNFSLQYCLLSLFLFLSSVCLSLFLSFFSILCRSVSKQSSGATLLSYLTLKELDKNNGGNLKFWIMFLVHRYIR